MMLSRFQELQGLVHGGLGLGAIETDGKAIDQDPVAGAFDGKDAIVAQALTDLEVEESAESQGIGTDQAVVAGKRVAEFDARAAFFAEEASREVVAWQDQKFGQIQTRLAEEHSGEDQLSFADESTERVAAKIQDIELCAGFQFALKNTLNAPFGIARQFERFQELLNQACADGVCGDVLEVEPALEGLH